MVTPSPLPGGGRSLHSDPWREGHRTLPRSGPINRSVRPSTPAGQVAGPVIHEPAATLEQVRAPVGCLDLAADLVRKGSLRHLARMIGLFGRPVPEARPEAVRHRRDVQLPEQFRQRRVPDRLCPQRSETPADCCERAPAPPPGSPGRDGTAGPGARDSPSCAGPGCSTHPRRCRFSAPSRPRSWEREEGSGGGDGGARGELSPVGGSKGPEPLASPNVLHWVGWLPGTTRCGAGPAVPPRTARRTGRPSSAAEVRADQPAGPDVDSRRPSSRPSHP